MPLPVSMVAMWFPATINSVMCLYSVVGELVVEVGSGFGHDKRNTRPADVLAPEKPAASLRHH